MNYRIQYESFNPVEPGRRLGSIRWIKGRIETCLSKVSCSRSVVVDIGCGHGFALDALKELGFQHRVGFEVDRDQAATAREYGHTVVLGKSALDFVESLEPGSCDAILFIDVLEHIPKAELDQLIPACKNALKRRGVVIVQVPNAASPVGYYLHANDYTHQTHFSHKSLSFLLKKSGFDTVIHIPESSFPERPSLRPWSDFFLHKWRRYLFRRCWQSVLMHELCESEQAEMIPTDPNLMMLATMNHD